MEQERARALRRCHCPPERIVGDPSRDFCGRNLPMAQRLLHQYRWPGFRYSRQANVCRREWIEKGRVMLGCIGRPDSPEVRGRGKG